MKLAVAVLIMGDYWLNRSCRRNEDREIAYSEKTCWQIISHGQVKKVTILPSTVITTWLIFLHTRELAPILIAKDSLGEDDFRRLIVKLKITSANQSN